MRLARQLKEEAGPCLDHIFLILKVKKAFPTRKLLESQKRVMILVGDYR